jgi:hypothetical protein
MTTAYRIFATFALLAVLGTAHATRVLEQPERSFELSLSQLTLPSSASGALTIKACADCPYRTHILNAGTQYFVNRQIVPFEDFSRIAGEIRANRRALETAFAGVYVDVDTGRVTRVTLLYRGQ